MMNNASKYKALIPLWRFLHKHHAIVFIVAVFGSLALATFSLYTTIIKSSETTAPQPSTSFDNATIEKINQLQTVDEQSKNPQSPPMSSRNPFVE